MRLAFWPNAFHLPLTTEPIGKECCAWVGGSGRARKAELSPKGLGEGVAQGIVRTDSVRLNSVNMKHLQCQSPLCVTPCIPKIPFHIAFVIPPL